MKSYIISIFLKIMLSSYVFLTKLDICMETIIRKNVLHSKIYGVEVLASFQRFL